nr:hypothetical protein [Chitinophagales bacterium]
MGKGTRTALVALTALIVLICIYCLSFTFKVNSIEKEAIALAEKAIPMQDLDKRYPGNQLAQFLYEDSIHQSRINHKNRYLDSISNEKVYLWNTYKACKEQQLNLGLDLQGGMSVVLQVSLKELLSTLADNSRDPKFNKALDVAEQRMSSANNDYVSLFLEAYKEQNPTTTLAQLFSTRNNKEDINAESSNSDVEKFIRAKAKEAFDVTLNRLTTRIDQFGTKQPTITSEPARERISVEIAGVDNPARVRKLLQATANLEFWETYKATEIGKSLNDANTVLKNYLDTQKDLGKDSAVMSKAQSLLTASTDSSAEAVNPLSGKKDTSKLAKKDTSQA